MQTMMSPKWLVPFVILLLSPLAAAAHGSVEHVAGNTIVSLSQHPLSPLVDEEITMTFILSHKDAHSRLVDTDVTLNVIRTTEGDAEKDAVIRTETLRTDVNGTFKAQVGPFDEERYYDVELTFKDPVTQEVITTGFLIEPRALPQPPQTPMELAAALAFMALAGYCAGRRS
jgi:hypothetical protein